MLFLLGGLLFPSTGHDDSYITFWPARVLATSGAITNYNGEPVEQSSSLFHVLLLGLAHALTRIPIPVLATVVGVLAGVGSALVAGRIAGRHTPGAAPLAAVFAATSPIVVYWGFGRLETPFVALLAGLAILTYAGYLTHGRALGWSAFATLLFVLVRPEAPFVLLSVLVGALVLRRLMPEVPARRLAVLIGVLAGCAAVVVGARLLLFGSPFPQPVHAKSGGITAESIGRGLG